MPKLKIDRRDFFRLEDDVHLIRHPIEKHMLCDDPYASQYNLPRQAVLISQLQAIDNEAQSMLAQVIESNRAVGGYMRAIDKKIRCIAKHLISDYDADAFSKETVELSEGGISFISDTPLNTDSYLHLTLMLFPSCATIACIGEVKSCEALETADAGYRIGVEFYILLEVNHPITYLS